MAAAEVQAGVELIQMAEKTMPLDIQPGIIQQLSPEQSLFLGTDASVGQLWTYGGMTLFIPGYRLPSVVPGGYGGNPSGPSYGQPWSPYTDPASTGSAFGAPGGSSWCPACGPVPQSESQLEGLEDSQ